MRNTLIAIASSLSLFACNKNATSTPAATPPAQQAAPVATAGIHGKVLEKISEPAGVR